MNKIKTFRAPDMQSALDLVRREMGTDAVILHTKQIQHRRRFPWSKQVTEVEITAGLNQSTQTTLKAASRPQPDTTEFTTLPAQAEPVAALAGHKSQQASGTAESNKSLAMQLLDQIGQGQDEIQLDSLSSQRPGLSASLSNKPALRSRESFLDRPLTPEKPQATTPEPTRQRAPQSRKPSPRKQRVVDQQQKNSPTIDPSRNLEERLQNIEKMLLQLGRQATTQAIQEIPNELFHLYTELIDADLNEVVARDLIFELKQQCRPQDLETPERTKAILAGMLEKQFSCSGEIQVTPGRRKVVALVGATGVGKTTTIAKLAANFKLRQGIKVGLVTVDTYRIAAVEQLKTYAEIMEIPLKVVNNPAEMRQALDHLQGLDLVLIDTGGRSPHDNTKVQELKALLQEAQADEVHVVLNMNSNFRNLESTAKKFQEIGSTAMLFTKLDETNGLGSMVGLARKVSLPVSYLTTGQDVPDDYEPAVGSRMVRLLLGEEKLN